MPGWSRRARCPKGRPRHRPDWDKAADIVRAVPQVKSVAPYAEIQALAVHTPEMRPIILRGIDPAREVHVTDIASATYQGSITSLVPGTDRVLVGEYIAQDLALSIGDSISILVPTIAPNGTPTPAAARVPGGRRFSAGTPDYDSMLVMSDLASIRPIAAGNEGLRVLFDDALAAPELSAQVRKALPPSFEVIDWTQDHASYFRAIRIEKRMMGIILMLVVAVAAFSIVAMLVMVVTDKRTDIAILRTLGASPRRIIGVFMSQGLVIGWVGVTLGVIFGVILAYNADPVMRFLEKRLRLPGVGFERLLRDVAAFRSALADGGADRDRCLPAHRPRHDLSGVARVEDRAGRSAEVRASVAAYELLIGTRHLRSTHRRGFVSFVALISVMGLDARRWRRSSSCCR